MKIWNCHAVVSLILIITYLKSSKADYLFIHCIKLLKLKSNLLKIYTLDMKQLENFLDFV